MACANGFVGKGGFGQRVGDDGYVSLLGSLLFRLFFLFLFVGNGRALTQIDDVPILCVQSEKFVEFAFANGEHDVLLVLRKACIDHRTIDDARD